MTSRISSAFVQSRPGSEIPQQKRSTRKSKEAKQTEAHAIAQEDHHIASGSKEEDEMTLRQFDLESRYGPLSGISRLQRWQRAETLGLQPPEHIKEIIMKHGESTSFNQHLFTEGKV